MREMKYSGIEWVGGIPKSWNLRRLQWCLEEVNETNNPVRTTQVLSLTNTLGVVPYEEKGNQGNKAKENYAEYKIAYENTLVVNSMNVIIGSVGISRYYGCVSPVYYVFRETENADLRFVNYIFSTTAFQKELRKYAKGILEIRLRISASELFKRPIPFPPKVEQKLIADFLDRECSEINVLISRTRESIAEYKKLKQAVITQAVTKGIRGERPMKDSGVEWLGTIPVDWRVYRIANLYDERSENGLEELPILTVSINSGVSDYEIADEDKDRVFIRSEDRTKYKRVYPGDLTYNMMRAWQGAFGAVRVNGMVSPAYVVAKPKAGVQLDSRYMEALLRTQEAIEEMHRYSRGIVDFRLRLYWPEFKNIRICLPGLEEQTEIADYIDEKAAAIDKLIAQKEQFIIELQNYKKTLIYEYVTGKKEVPMVQTAPVVTFLDARALLVCRIVELMKPKGRIHLQKAIHMVDCLLGLNSETQYSRHKHGPYDVRIQEYEQAAEKKGWIKVKQGSSVEYSAGAKLEEYRDAYLSLYGDVDAEIQRICAFLAPMKTSQSERVATLLAAWNDFLLDGVSPTDQQLIQEVRTNWTPNKANSPEATWQDTLNKIRNNGFIPKGKGKHTITEQ